MMDKRSKRGDVRLERLCTETSADWIRTAEVIGGVALLEAWFQGAAYQKHRHDTYGICLTDRGIQSFDYRGAAEISTPGEVVVLHPDEVHDGQAGTEAGFGYRMLYVEPSLISEAVREIRGRHGALPFVHTPVSTNVKLSTAIAAAFQFNLEPLAIDSLMLQLAEGLMAGDSTCQSVAPPRAFDQPALERARQFLDTKKTRVVHSSELEAVTGLTRYELARQFRWRYGTSPYRYLLMRRLDEARDQIAGSRLLVDIALEAGFADQAHFSRMFKAAFGITSMRYRVLSAPAVEDASSDS